MTNTAFRALLIVPITLLLVVSGCQKNDSVSLKESESVSQPEDKTDKGGSAKTETTTATTTTSDESQHGNSLPPKAHAEANSQSKSNLATNDDNTQNVEDEKQDVNDKTQGAKNEKQDDEDRSADSDPVMRGAKTAEEAMRTFYVSIVKHDFETLQRVTFPIKAEDLSMLSAGQKATPEAIKFFETVKIRELEPGDSWSIPGSEKENKLTKEHFSDGRRMFQAEGDALPFNVYERKDGWKVDATPLIVMRKKVMEMKSRKN